VITNIHEHKTAGAVCTFLPYPGYTHLSSRLLIAGNTGNGGIWSFRFARRLYLAGERTSEKQGMME